MAKYRRESKKTCEVIRRGGSKPFTSMRRGISKVSSSMEHGRPPRDEVCLWLADSDDSVKVARDNFEMGNYHVAAFYTHQAIEKALKAAIIGLKRKTPSKTHSLKQLYSEVAGKVELTDEQKDFLGELTPAAQVARYVNAAVGLPREVYSKRLVEEYLEKALPILNIIRKRIEELY